MTICRTLQNNRYLLTLLLVTMSVLTFSGVSCWADELLLGTGSERSLSHFVGRAICRAVNKHSVNVQCRTMPTTDYAHNLTNVQGGALDVALVNSKLINDALSHTGFFRYMDISYDNLRYILPLYRVPISLVVRQDAGIATFSDLKGKRINSGAPLSMQGLIFDEIMTAMGWQKSDFDLYQSLPAVNAQDFIAFNSGTVQAMLHIGVHPDARLERQLSHLKSELVGINDSAISPLFELKNGFCKYSVPTGSYVGIPDKLDTLAMETMLISSEDLDTGTVTMILDAILSERKRLKKVHPAILAAEINIDEASGCKILPHPVAALYFSKKNN